MKDLRKVLVLGGGVGGLSAAIACAQRGVETEVIEKRPDFNTPGVGLGQPACALRVYREFGVLDEILDQGFSYNHMSIFDPDRTLIVEHRFQMGGNGIPAFCALPRSRLHSILYKRALALGVKFRFNTEVEKFGGPLGSDILFNDGSAARYDVVAGFDGIRSSARHYIVGDMFGPRRSGIGAWRVPVERADCVTGMEFLQGVNGKAGAIPIAQDKMYLFNIRPENPDEVFEPAQMHILLKERLSQFGGYVADIANNLTQASPIVYGTLEPFIVPYPWHKGAVVMGGDAAHVVPPHLTAGAAMAAEDACVLVNYLFSRQGTLQDRLAAYGTERFNRNAFVYTFAMDWMTLEQSVHSRADLARTRAEYARNIDPRISVADRILDSFECQATEAHL